MLPMIAPWPPMRTPMMPPVPPMSPATGGTKKRTPGIAAGDGIIGRDVGFGIALFPTKTPADSRCPSATAPSFAGGGVGGCVGVIPAARAAPTLSVGTWPSDALLETPRLISDLLGETGLPWNGDLATAGVSGGCLLLGTFARGGVPALSSGVTGAAPAFLDGLAGYQFGMSVGVWGVGITVVVPPSSGW